MKFNCSFEICCDIDEAQLLAELQSHAIQIFEDYGGDLDDGLYDLDAEEEISNSCCVSAQKLGWGTASTVED